MKSSLAVRKLMMFSFQVNSERNKGKKNETSSGASCDGVPLCLHLALLAIFASPSHCYKLYAYDLDNIVSTKIFCLVHSRNYDSTTSIKKIEKRSLTHSIWR